MVLVERRFVGLTTRKLHRSAHRSVVALEAGIRDLINVWNKGEAVHLDKTADEVLETFAAYCQRINDSEHW